MSELGKPGDAIVVESQDQRIPAVIDYQISPSPSCPHQGRLQAHLLDLQTHLRVYHRHRTHFPLTELILLVETKPAIYTCNFFLQSPKVHGLM